MSSLPWFFDHVQRVEVGSLVMTLIMFKVCKVSCFSPSLVSSRRFAFLYNCRLSF